MSRFSIESIVIDKSSKDIQTGRIFEFKDGINLIYGCNESGKSSLLAFMRQGLFKAKGADKGRIYFKITDENSEKHYRADIQDNKSVDLRCRLFDENNNAVNYDFLERIVNKKYFFEGFTIDLDDLMKIQNKDTSGLIDTIKDPSGEKLSMQLDKIKNEAKGIFGGNNRLTKDTAGILEKIRQKNAEINALSNLETEYCSAVKEIETLNSELDKIYKIEAYSGVLIKIKDLENKMNEILEKKKISFSEFNEKLFNNQEKYAEIISSSGKLEADRKSLIKNSAKTEQLNSKIKENLNRLKNEFSLDLSSEEIERVNINYGILKQLKEFLSVESGAEKEIFALKQNKENTLEVLSRLKHEAEPYLKEEEKRRKSMKINIILIILLAVSIAAGFFSFYSRSYAAGIFASITASGLLAVLLRNRQNKETEVFLAKNSSDTAYNEEKLKNITDKILQLEEKIKTSGIEAEKLVKTENSGIDIPAQIYIDTAGIIKSIQENSAEIKAVNIETRELENEVNKITNEFNEFTAETGIILYGSSYDENIIKLKSINEKNLIIKNSIDILDIQIENIKKQIESLENEKIKFTELQNKYIPLEELAALKQEKLNQKKEAEFKKRKLEEFEGLNGLKIKREVLLDEYRNRIFTLLKDRMILNLTKTAKDRFDAVQPDLKNAQKYLEILTEGKYSKINLDLEEIQNSDKSIIKNWNILSRGMKEQLYLALRLGYASNYTLDRITGKQNNRANLPLIIDDAFVNFDDKRLQQGIKCLIEFSKTNQIIFFTCSEAVMKRSFELLCYNAGLELNIINI